MGPNPASGALPESPARPAVVLSCEHAGAEIPAAFRAEFRVPPEVLDSHRGVDFGTLDYGAVLGRGLDVEPIVQTVTRLLVDTNRSEESPERLSEFSRAMPDALQDQAVREHWAPHRDRVIGAVEERIAAGLSVLHLAAHSFTSVLDGVTRDVDIGILFDPARPRELAFAERLLGCLAAQRPDLRTRLNEPYLGTADCLGLVLRARHPDAHYAGVELEINQRFALDLSDTGRTSWKRLQADFAHAVVTSLPPEEGG